LSAFEEIVRSKGTQFDPAVVDAFTEAFSQGTELQIDSRARA
jgi:HD-GYP domain-containing protein (c-di-GMP phosphodiesterase class II)